jgi:hypothetical protein
MGRIFMTDSENAQLRMHECGQSEYWFYHKDSFPNDPPILYKQLIDNAHDEIIVWDPYFNVQPNVADEQIFQNIRSDITIKILTCKGVDSENTYLTNVLNAMKTIISPDRDCRFGLRVVDKGDINQAGYQFHDRFLIIDNQEVYLIGSSLGYHVKEHLSTGIFKVLNADTKEFIKSIFKDYWDKSIQKQIPTAYLH